MTSPSSEAPSTDPSYNNLMRRALRHIGRSSARERALAQVVASTELELDEAKRRASIGAAGDEVPEQITHALRAPKGVDPVVIVYHDGMTIKASLYSQGKRNPRREAAVWRCIRETAIRAREQLP